MKSIILPLLIAAAIATYAQQLAPGTKAQPPGMAAALATAKSHMPPGQKSLRSLEERLVGQSEYFYQAGTGTGPLIFVDSGYYSYSNGRGAGTEYYTTCDTAIQVDDSSGVFDINTLQRNYFDGSGDLVTTLFLVRTGGTLDTSYEVLYTYDANHNMLTNITRYYLYNGIWDVPLYYYGYSYDAHNRVLTDTFRYWDAAGNVLQPNALTTYTYLLPNDSSELLTNVLNQYWDSSGASWINQSNQIWQYNANDQDTLYALQKWTGAAWADSLQSLVTYLLPLQFITVNQYYALGWQNRTETYDYYLDIYTDTLHIVLKWTGTAWRDSVRDITESTGPDTWTDYHQGNGYPVAGWLNDYSTTNVYDSYNNPIISYYAVWSDTVYVNNSVNYYYYQEYAPSGIAEVASPRGSLRLYPSPASSMLNIDLAWKEAQSATMAIYDASGKIWRQWKVPSGTTYQDTAPVAALPPGNYYLSVSGRDGQLSKSFTVIR